MRRPNLTAMHAFRRVVELRSFAAAATSLDMTGGAVSKLVAQLERDLGVRLLHRTTRQIHPSAEGLRYYEAAARILDDVDAATDIARAQAGAPAGLLRLSVPTSFALRWLSPRLPSFMDQWPQLELDLVLNDRFVDIVQEGFDCAIRITTQLPDSSLMARRLGSVRRVLVAAPRYLAHAPPLQAPEDLAQHACLLYTQTATPQEWPLRGTRQGRPVAVRGTCRINNSVMLRDLLVAGQGVTLTPEFVVQDLLANGSLTRLLPDCEPAPLTVYGVVAQQRYMAHKVKVWLDFIEAGLQGA